MKKLLCAAMAVLLVFLMAGCGSDQPKKTGFQPALDTNSDAHIRIYGSYSNFEALEAAFDHFNAYYPNVQLTYTKPDDYNNTISTILGGKDAPNIFFAYSWMYGKPQYDKCFEVAENLSDPALGLNLDCIRPGLLTRDAKGDLPMVPVFSTSHGMLVNNDLFKKEGLKVPATYQELLDVCAAFKEKGYVSPMLGFNETANGSFVLSLTYPMFCAALQNNPEAIRQANSGDQAAGEYMRPCLEVLQTLAEQGCVNLDECAKLTDGYTQLILRFFEGDVPMVICTGDTVSGTKKRESQSEAFTNHPFTYSFVPIPTTDQGGYFLDTPSVEFAVNKNCADLDMTNEFMRFLITFEELNSIAEVKRLVTASTDLTFDSVYAPFASVPADRILSPEAMGIMDEPTIQLRYGAFRVITGDITIDDAVAQYGSLAQ